jgi:hypothetical protein
MSNNLRCATVCGAQCAVCGLRCAAFNSYSTAVCSSVQVSVLQCLRQCAAVRQCAHSRVRLSGCAAVCGNTAVCGSAHGYVR